LRDGEPSRSYAPDVGKTLTPAERCADDGLTALVEVQAGKRRGIGWDVEGRGPLAVFNLFGVRRVLVTGMSGTGKSSALVELGRLGFEVVDTDDPGWTVWSDTEGGYVWREDRIESLLAADTVAALFVSGTVSNQGKFYSRFDAVVLLSAPVDVLLVRIEKRTTNGYGKTPEERELFLQDLADVQPLLRRTCTHEIDATQPLDRVVRQLAELGRERPA
jgi:shikimate kinase